MDVTLPALEKLELYGNCIEGLRMPDVSVCVCVFVCWSDLPPLSPYSRRVARQPTFHLLGPRLTHLA